MTYSNLHLHWCFPFYSANMYTPRKNNIVMTVKIVRGGMTSLLALSSLVHWSSFDRYSWLFYVNPQYYGYSAMAKVLLKDLPIKCVYNSTLNCFGSDGNALLARFGFSDVNPQSHLVVSYLRARSASPP